MADCPEINCFAPDIACALGHLEPQRCPRWAGSEKTSSEQFAGEDQILLPWTGAALGLVDIAFIAGREKPMLVAIAGPESAGKTTLLACWYLLMGRGTLLGDDARFSGSYSLAGWEAIAGSLRWQPGQPPSFPPHTSSRAARAPGLLHMSVRSSSSRSRDLLFADAPGAWFQQWAINAEAEEAGGARWLALHADIFLIVADRQALAGAKLGQARNSFQLLAKRIASERRGRPVALVWTKGDVEVASAMEDVIRSAVFDDMPDAVQFKTSVVPTADGGESDGQDFAALFAWLLAARRAGAVFDRDLAATIDPLFVFGRR